MKVLQSNLACTYGKLGRDEETMRMRCDIHAGTLRLHGAEHGYTLIEANNYAACLARLKRFEEAKSLLRKTIPVARRVFGDSKETTIRMRLCYAKALILDDSATVDDLREAVMTLENAERIARRVLGGAHPLIAGIETTLRTARAALRAREAGQSVVFT